MKLKVRAEQVRVKLNHVEKNKIKEMFTSNQMALESGLWTYFKFVFLVQKKKVFDVEI